MQPPRQREHRSAIGHARSRAISRWPLGLSFASACAGASVCILLLAVSTSAQFNLRKIRGVKYPELYPRTELEAAGRSHTNQLKGLLTGEEGELISTDSILVRTMQLEHYAVDGRTNVVARAPECLFNPHTRLAWSTGRLEITALEGRFFIESNEGFEGSLTNTSLILSNRVRTVLRQNLSTLQIR